MDDITELLKVKGVTPELFWGGRLPGGGAGTGSGAGSGSAAGSESTGSVGLVDIFCTQGGPLNVNTASREVLTLVLGDPALAQQVLERRSGMDGQAGTSDDLVARSVSDLVPIPVGGGAGGGAAAGDPSGSQGVGVGLGVRSLAFEVRVKVEWGSAKARYVALLRRGGATPRDFQTLYFRRE
jgi:hypothetical protein